MPWWLSIIVAVVILFLIVDPLLGAALRSEVSIRYQSSPSYPDGSSTLLVYLPGLVCDGEVSSKELLRTWKFQGDVALVSYRGQRIRPKEVIENVCDLLKNDDHQHIVMIGSSMGGLLANDIYQRIRPELNGRRVSFLLLASPMQAKDLKPLPTWAAWLPSLVRGGPILNLFSRRAMRLMVQPIATEPAVDQEYYAFRIKQARSYKLTYWLDGVRYITTHPPIKPGSLKDVRITFVRCEDDELVRRDAYLGWLYASDTFRRVDVKAGHVTFAEWPTLWNNTFRKALTKMMQ